MGRKAKEEMEYFQERSIKILNLLKEGTPVTEIGGIIFLSFQTVRNYIEALKELHEAKNTPHLIYICTKKGIIQ